MSGFLRHNASAVTVALAVAVVIVTPALGRVPRDLPPVAVGNLACRTCHQQIYDSYAQTAMARTSGSAPPNLIEGQFTHASSGVVYTLSRQGGRAVLAYHRPGDPGLAGTVSLEYFVGSNTRGRTFLFDIDGFLYQAPVNYFAHAQRWDMSPGYASLTAMELNHPVDRTCLFCHASRVASVQPGTRNQFPRPVFLQDGVGCERCHGPGSAHVAGKSTIVNPAKLAPDPRDSICMQCHLEGQTRIVKAGRVLDDFTPGERLSDFLSVFVFANNATASRGAVSHVESFEASRCRQASGDSMSCTSCHDPHSTPRPDDRSGYYRRKCLACHAPLAMQHHPAQRDCTTCHMPRLDSADIEHTVVTDHRILRDIGSAPSVRAVPDPELVQFGRPRPEARDLGLAYAEIALRGNAMATERARPLLEEALASYPTDVELLTRLAFLLQSREQVDRAAGLYERALAVNPFEPVAVTNFGVILANRGMLPKALRVWMPAFDRHPEASELGVNIAMALCASGDRRGASDTLRRVMRHNPDYPIARRAAEAIARDGPVCGSH